MKTNAERFMYPHGEPLRVIISDDGRLMICLLDICRIVGISGLNASQVLDRLNPYQRIQRKLDTGAKALFITYPELVSIPVKLHGVNEQAVKRLAEYIKREITPTMRNKNDMLSTPTSAKIGIREARRPEATFGPLPKTYTEALRELADTTERLEAMKVELQEMKQTAGYVRELTTLVERTLLLNGIRI